MRKRFIRPIEEFSNHFNALKESGKKFSISYVGNRNTIFYEDKKWVFGNRITDENRDIVYCCRRVKYDCETALKNNLVEYKDIPESFPTLIKNISKFKEHEYWFRFDIESCYWNIAYHNVPFLTMQTYFEFYNKKDARNIALGSLGRLEVAETYENGIRTDKKLNKSIINNIYYQVRYKAYEFYLNINEICEGNVGYYHTDEYIIPDQYVDKVIRYLKSQNTFPKSKDYIYYNVKSVDDKKVLLENSIFTDEQRFII
jgi:hypothetical protein